MHFSCLVRRCRSHTTSSSSLVPSFFHGTLVVCTCCFVVHSPSCHGPCRSCTLVFRVCDVTSTIPLQRLATKRRCLSSLLCSPSTDPRRQRENRRGKGKEKGSHIRIRVRSNGSETDVGRWGWARVTNRRNVTSKRGREDKSGTRKKQQGER